MNKEFKYDVFISYKRNGGTPWAELLYIVVDKIIGKNVFIDRNNLESGTDKDWENDIFDAIRSSLNVVVVVFPGIQDVLYKRKDFFIRELQEAIRESKERRINIIPFYVDGISSAEISSSTIYNKLPSALKRITSPKHNDLRFNPENTDAWINKLKKSLISQETVLYSFCYLVQVSPDCKMSVYDDSSLAKDRERKLIGNGDQTHFWLAKKNDILVLRFVAEDGSKYKVTINTSVFEFNKTPKKQEAYYYLQEGKELPRPDGIITMISQNVIRLGINWNIIKMLPEDKMPILDSLVNTYNILGYE